MTKNRIKNSKNVNQENSTKNVLTKREASQLILLSMKGLLTKTDVCLFYSAYFGQNW